MERPALPELRNSLLVEGRAPLHEVLVERRCLGQTELKVKPGQVGTSNATKQENLGTLDYAHLRVPLPRDLSGSGIFTRGTNRRWPEAYFLMRRSQDGYISATGMFKAAFPHAQIEEEVREKDYIKGLEDTSQEEVAGNVWISPAKALELAEEYGIKLWIAALLDPEPIAHGTSESRAIQSPPTYVMEEAADGIGRTPAGEKKTDGRRSTRGARSLRSESPTNAKTKGTPARKMATPRKPRKGRSARDETASIAEDLAEDMHGEALMNGDDAQVVKVEVESTFIPDASGEETTESTKVNVEVPANHADFKIPDNAEDMLEKARQMVVEAQKIEGGASSSGKGKRKAGELEEIDGAEESAPSAKRSRPVELELRKERVRRRALTGIAGVLAVGALIPSIMAAFPWS